jgi:predicted anti-sigma-YlaC factor YlaD
MTGMAGCREIKQALGVYVLGAIDPVERAQVDQHLATCADCREELAGLAGLPAMLRKVPFIEAERLAAAEQEPAFAEAPSPEMLPSLVARTANVRRIRRWRGLAAAAAVALVAVAGGAAVTSALQSSGSSPPGNPQLAGWHQTAGAGPAPGAHLTVEYRHEPWGTQMRVNVTGLRSGTVCQFRVTDKAGGKSVVGSWVSWQATTWYPASTWQAENELRAFQVTVNGHLVASAPAT